MDSTGPEWAALELMSTDPRSPEELERFRLLISDPACHFGELIEQAIRHRLLCRFAALLVAPSWKSVIPNRLRFHILTALRSNRHQIQLFRGAASVLSERLIANGVRFAFTKGIVLESTIYRGEGTRLLGDIDLMTAPADRQRVASVLVELGYQNGDYHWDSNEIRPLSRSEAVTYALHKDHLPHFIRVISDPALPYIKVDVANSLTWSTSEWTIPVDVALSGLEWFDIGGTKCPRMRWSVGFLFIILHCFREAWFEDNIGDGEDIALSTLADVYLTWRYHGETILDEGVAELIRAHGLERPVAWVLAHVDRTLGSSMLAQLNLQRHADEAWLRSLRGRSGSPAACNVTMRERLRSRDRTGLVSPAS